MALNAKSQRCTVCSIQYPPEFENCSVCGIRLWALFKSGPDENWKEKVKARLGIESIPPEPEPTIAYVTPHKADVSIPLHINDGRMWLPHEALLEVGYLNLESGSVVYVNGRFYELQGRNRRMWWADGSPDMWWVEEIVTDGAFADVTPEDIING